ncbi:LuxR family transcriptional regulator [Kitasatospora sp. MMS16-BH015]|uniref:LuxR C-terminal-related transcriptional regulator n=1 Tax=Kitasatospora sp. MMS16-BH015 TaxID=2018025 RepID=UPI000CA2C628|nr:response regulator transcription factor [Kitasatospora sp. MMS16-BH015]AUG80623.1 LuxR family transcriptional regulator [Kitasatospora sp. MMS16-BH015]
MVETPAGPGHGAGAGRTAAGVGAGAGRSGGGLALVVADAERLLADALALALTGRGYRVRATATTRNGLLRAVLHHRPDACLLDLHLSDGRALDVIEAIHRAVPTTRILALSREADPGVVEIAIEAGAAGYLSKDRGVEALDRALRRITAGELFVEANLTLEARQGRPAPGGRSLRWLTHRELEVLRRLTEGDGTVEIARALDMTTNTARTHVQNVLDKLGVHSRLEAVALANRLKTEQRSS